MGLPVLPQPACPSLSDPASTKGQLPGTDGILGKFFYRQLQSSARSDFQEVRGKEPYLLLGTKSLKSLTWEESLDSTM